jgi:1,4-dihydroxy-2-naphthoate octaprenyltransferase
MSASSFIRAWVIASRPRTLPAAIVPVLVGAAMAARELILNERPFNWLVFVAALVSSLLIQIGTNTTNDVADYLKGADKNRKGPQRVTQSGLLTPRQVIIGTVVIFALAALLGVYLISVGGVPILIIGALSIIAGVAYTAGPYPLAYHGLGDLFAFLFFGVIAVCGTYFVLTLEMNWWVVLASVPVACLVTAIIVANNLRDIESDRAANKRTFAVILGDTNTRRYFGILIYAALFVAAFVLIMGSTSLWIFFLLFAAQYARQLARDARNAKTPPEYISLLKSTANMHMVFGAGYAFALLFS